MAQALKEYGSECIFMDKQSLYDEQQKRRDLEQHEQLQEQRLRLKQILDQQRIEQENEQVSEFQQPHCSRGKDFKSIPNLIPLRKQDSEWSHCSHIVENKSLLNHNDLFKTLQEKVHLKQQSISSPENQSMYTNFKHECSNVESSEIHELSPSVSEQDYKISKAISVTSPLDYTFDNLEGCQAGISSHTAHEDSVQKVGETPLPWVTIPSFIEQEKPSCSSNESSNVLPTKVKMFGPECLSQSQKNCFNVPASKAVDAGNPPLECEWSICTELFAGMEEYVIHVEKHIDELVLEREVIEDGENQMPACLWRDCTQRCEDTASMVRHVYYHAFHTKLKSVGQNMQQNSNLQACQLDTDGRNLVPQIPEPFECQWDDCGLKFVSAQHFYWHLETHAHCAETLDTDRGVVFTCGWSGCSHTASKMCRLKEHTRSHSQEKLFGCPHCGGIFSSKSRFFDHLIKQVPIESLLYQCSCCSRRFANERLLRDHMRNHINHYKCPHCDMTCASRGNLRSHVNFRHCKDKPHLCQQCPKSFKTVPDLQRHLITHTDQTVFNCHYPNCTKKCKSPTTLDRHIRKAHLLSKDVYACHLCPAERATGALLSHHLMTSHNLTWPSGHSRFFYRRDASGQYRLQTVRYESLELSQGLDNNNAQDYDHFEELSVQSD